MREIVIISGKGGTGKTTVCAAFAHLMQGGLLCDLDVDVPDLHIISAPQQLGEHAFISGQEAVIDNTRCTACKSCMTACRFGAVLDEAGACRISSLYCEGCGLCAALCPEAAITMRNRHCGTWFESQCRFGPMFHAQLFPGEENSGRLVALLRQKAREYAKNRELDLILCDGAPGVGCQVISSLSGAHLAVAVVEPTPSGRHDFMRVGQLCEHFHIPVCVIINKADLNRQESAALRAWCEQRHYELAGEIPFHQDIITAMIQKKAVTETASPLAGHLVQAWSVIRDRARATPRFRL